MHHSVTVCSVTQSFGAACHCYKVQYVTVTGCSVSLLQGAVWSLCYRGQWVSLLWGPVCHFVTGRSVPLYYKEQYVTPLQGAVCQFVTLLLGVVHHCYRGSVSLCYRAQCATLLQGAVCHSVIGGSVVTVTGDSVSLLQRAMCHSFTGGSVTFTGHSASLLQGPCVSLLQGAVMVLLCTKGNKTCFAFLT